MVISICNYFLLYIDSKVQIEWQGAGSWWPDLARTFEASDPRGSLLSVGATVSVVYTHAHIIPFPTLKVSPPPLQLDLCIIIAKNSSLLVFLASSYGSATGENNILRTTIWPR